MYSTILTKSKTNKITDAPRKSPHWKFRERLSSRVQSRETA